MKAGTKRILVSVGKDILLTVGMLGFVTVAAIAGNAVQLLKYTPLGDRKRPIKKFELNRSIKRLLDRGLLKKQLRRNTEYLELTDVGKRVLLKYQLEGLSKSKREKWDGKYRVVIFDISEQRKKTRDHLRRILRSFGFICLQNSVWIYPYHCEEIIELLKQYLDLKGEVIYMTIESIENEARLKESFDL